MLGQETSLSEAHLAQQHLSITIINVFWQGQAYLPIIVTCFFLACEETSDETYVSLNDNIKQASG